MKEILNMLKKSNMYSPISLKQLNEIEERFNIILPEDFKMFYTTISNGNIDVEGYELNDIDTILLKSKFIDKKFKFSKEYIWGDENSLTPHEEIQFGNIEIVDMGDGASWHLIINGDSYDTMWLFSEFGIMPCTPHHNFIEWFEKWFNQEKGFFY